MSSDAPTPSLPPTTAACSNASSAICRAALPRLRALRIAGHAGPRRFPSRQCPRRGRRADAARLGRQRHRPSRCSTSRPSSTGSCRSSASGRAHWCKAVACRCSRLRSCPRRRLAGAGRRRQAGGRLPAFPRQYRAERSRSITATIPPTGCAATAALLRQEREPSCALTSTRTVPTRPAAIRRAHGRSLPS